MDSKRRRRQEPEGIQEQHRRSEEEPGSKSHAGPGDRIPQRIGKALKAVSPGRFDEAHLVVNTGKDNHELAKALSPHRQPYYPISLKHTSCEGIPGSLEDPGGARRSQRPARRS